MRRQRVLRVLVEVLIVAAAGVIARFVGPLSWAGVALAMLAAVVAVILVRLLPDSEMTAWPRLPTPERGGRRAEVYRLSWQLGKERDVAPGAAMRLESAVATVRRTASGPEADQLDALSVRLAARPNLAELTRILTDLERVLQRPASAATESTSSATPGSTGSSGPASPAASRSTT